GIRTNLGIKLHGPDLETLDRIARRIEATLRTVPGTSSVFAERLIGGYYLSIEPDRAALARHGAMIDDVQGTIAMALGGEVVTTTVEARERYGVIVRYPRELRESPLAIAREVLVPVPNGGMLPLGQLAHVRLEQGPVSIRTENAQLAAYIFIEARDRDIGAYVADAGKALAQSVELPNGVTMQWSGQFEYLERAKARLAVVVPLTLAIVFLLLYLNFRRLGDTLIVMLSLPFALTGGLWLMDWMNFNFSVAVAVGFIALAGVAAETGVVMLIYLEGALKERLLAAAREGRSLTREDLAAAVVEGAVERVRPKVMTVVTVMAGLLPIMWSDGTGSEVMQRIAVPMIGGMVSSTLLTLLVIPAIYALVRQWQIRPV
ncbi:MAG: efflux RND transporter permease subunit, partial [Alphaproteobacteria bacterium]|nr:efflux RND transporter permease subunit [Alphaproteobacteria bacterium]